MKWRTSLIEILRYIVLVQFLIKIKSFYLEASLKKKNQHDQHKNVNSKTMRKPVAMQRARKAWKTADIVEFSILFIHTLSIWRDISLSMIVFVFDTFGEESFYLFSFTIWSFWILSHIFHFHVWVVLVTHFSPRGFTAFSHFLRLVLDYQPFSFFFVPPSPLRGPVCG